MFTQENKEEKLIAVMGPTGSGKSSFIKCLTGDENVVIGHRLDSMTSDIKTHSFRTAKGQKVTLVDTPGFDDNREGMSDVDILQKITNFLHTDEGPRTLSGIIYFHRIQDPRVGGVARKNLRMLKGLCGTETLKNVVLATTFWDSVSNEVGSQREEELRQSDGLFKQLISYDARLMRHDHGCTSARQIVEYLIPKPPITPQIVNELMEGKALKDTTAGNILNEQIKDLMKKHEKDMASLKIEMEAAAKLKDEALRRELAEEKAELQQKIDQAAGDYQKLQDQAKDNERKLEEAKDAFNKQMAYYEAEKDKARQEQEILQHQLSQIQLSTQTERRRFEYLEKEITKKEEQLRRLDDEKNQLASQAKQGIFGRFFSTWKGAILSGYKSDGVVGGAIRASTGIIEGGWAAVFGG